MLKQSKKKSMKSFRGLVTGKSKKEKKKSQQSEAEPIPETIAETETKTTTQVTEKKPDVAAPLATPKEVKEVKEVKEPSTEAKEKKTTPEVKTVDEETVYGAEFDEASKAATATVSETLTKESESVPFADPIAIVLLLMDPDTRRFELLQLEFDTTKATVADILQQIPISATEESLRTQSFQCVCDTTGREYDHDRPLSDYVDGNAVVITVPKRDGKGSANAAKMARPILSDPKVEEMLRSAGVTVPPAPKAPQAPEDDTTEAKPITITSEEKTTPTPTPSAIPSTKVEPEPTTESPSSESKTSSGFTTLLIIAGVLAYVTRVLVNFQGETTAPLMPGSTMEPGAWKSRCGLIQSNGCEPAYIEMDVDGSLNIVKDEGVVFSLAGNVCGEDEVDCVPGVVVEEDGTLKIGGAVPKLVQKSKYPLNPWPFVEGVGATKGRKAWF